MAGRPLWQQDAIMRLRDIRRLPIHLGSGSLPTVQAGHPVPLSGSEAETALDIVLDALADKGLVVVQRADLVDALGEDSNPGDKAHAVGRLTDAIMFGGGNAR